MTAGSAAPRRVSGPTPVAPLLASDPKRPTGIDGRMSDSGADGAEAPVRPAGRATRG